MNYALQLLLVAYLNPKDFGDLAFLMSLCLIVVAPCSAASFSIARLVSNKNNFRKYFEINCLFSNYLYLSFGSQLLFVALFFAVSRFGIFNSEFPFDTLSLVFFFSFCTLLTIQTKVFAILWGENRIPILSLCGLSIALLKILFIWIWHEDIYQVMMAILLAHALIVILTLFLNKYLNITKLKSFKLKRIIQFLRDEGRFFGVVIFSALIIQSDVIIAKTVFSEEIAGQVVTALVLSKAVFFITSSLGMVAYPILSRISLSQRGFLILILGTIAIGTICAVMFYAFSEFVLTTLYGNISSLTVEVLKIYGFALIPIGIFSIIEHIGFAKGETHILVFQGLLVLFQLAASIWFVSQPSDFSVAFLVVNFSVAFMLVGYVWYRRFT
ncbi:MATE family efflux transporter [Candidatus Puniceispirillum marinum]|uniref:hypothetical protein n=1 Tax=Candidatus Puniceispirillum marinum TaxID=767892 RepID=UPI0002DC531F|nr:hypothetical protein [Candidatus Puniceispirillum marinum]